jgi:hypothetical protein
VRPGSTAGEAVQDHDAQLTERAQEESCPRSSLANAPCHTRALRSTCSEAQQAGLQRQPRAERQSLHLTPHDERSQRSETRPE